MWKFRRSLSLLNLTYSAYLKTTPVAKLVNLTEFTPIHVNFRYPFSYGCQNLMYYYSTGIKCSDPDTNLTEKCRAIDENECDSDDNVCNTDEDEAVEGKFGGSDKVSHDVGVILEILRGRGRENDPDVEEDFRGNVGVISGVEVARKLKECGVSPTSELVVEVLSRMRNDWELAFMFFIWAGKQPGYTHSVRQYHSIVSILAKRRKFDTAWSLIDEMRRVGIVSSKTLLIMIRRYSAAHDVVNAINTFHAFKRFNFDIGIDEFQQLLSALTRYKNVQEAEHLLFSNRNTFPFDTKSFNIILNGWCNMVGNPREGDRFWRLMIDQGIKLDVISYSSIISSYSKLGKLKEVIKLFDRMKGMGIETDRKVYNAVMHALAKGGRSKEALNLLLTMEDKGISPNAVTFNSLIKPLCKAQSRAEAEKVYGEMLRRGLQPTIRTFHAFLRIQRTAEDIFMLLDKMKELNCHPNKDTYLLLIKKFCRWRQLDNVFMLWNHMKEKGWNDDKSSYIALIHGLFLNGKLEEAHKIYTEMKEKSFLPDVKTDELIQTWLSNKEMAVSDITNVESGWVDSDHVSKKGNCVTNKFDKMRNFQEQPEYRKVVKERGFSFWD